MVQEIKINTPKVGDQLTGKVLFKKHTQVFVDLNTLGSGVIYGQAFYSAQDILKDLKLGDEILVQISDLENDEGYLELTVKEIEKELVWDSFKKKKDAGEVLKVKISQANRGGLITNLEGVSAFLPVSQLSFKNYPKVEGNDKSKILAELQKFLNKELEVKILNIDQKYGKLILSEKEIDNEELEKIMSSFKIGEVVDGVVSRLAEYGVFVRFFASQTPKQELEGLIHISELDWNMVNDPSEILKVGDKIKAKILDISEGRVALSLKALQPDPWQELSKKYKKDDLINGTVYKHTSYGAFVRIDQYIHGLCPLSEFESEEAMKQKLNLGKNYQFKISSLSAPEHRLNLTPLH